jgi:ATP-dependent DNA helicase RecQ
MEQDGLLKVSGDKFPVVTLGEDAERCREDGFRYVIKTPKREEPAGDVGEAKPGRKGAGGVAAGGTSKARAGRRGAAGEAPFDDELFEILRALRRSIADEAEIPAFIVFTDAALRDMCRVMPTNESEFLSVSGVGNVKLQQYGELFIEEIRSWVNAQAQES